MGNRYQFAVTRKPGTLAGVGSSFGALLGKTANVAGQLPGQIVSGVANGYRSGAAGFNQQRKMEAAYQLIQLVGTNLTEAKSVADQISDTVKQVIICNDPAERQKIQKEHNETIASLKKSFGETFGVDYDQFCGLINNFGNEADFLTTASELYKVAREDLEAERKELNEAKANALKDMEQAENDLNTREANLDNLAGQFQSTGIFSKVKDKILNRSHNAAD